LIDNVKFTICLISKFLAVFHNLSNEKTECIFIELKNLFNMSILFSL